MTIREMSAVWDSTLAQVWRRRTGKIQAKSWSERSSVWPQLSSRSSARQTPQLRSVTSWRWLTTNKFPWRFRRQCT